MGQLITIEGTDGSGKATQADLLVQALRQAGKKVASLAFPRYNEDSSLLLRQYLAGEFGGVNDVPAKPASAFFAYDRYMAAPTVRELLAANEVVILDRYVAANKGHQLGKIANLVERIEFLTWLNKLEYETNGIPIPDLTILLYLPVSEERSSISSAAKGGVKGDIHEQDKNHLRQAEQAYLWVAQNDPIENWQVVNCLDKTGRRLTPAELQTQVWQTVSQVYTLVK